MFKAAIWVITSVIVSVSAYSQNVDVTGIALGMTMEQAEAKLPAGFKLTPEKLPYAPNFQLVLASRDREFYALETVDGKIAFIDHQTYPAHGSEPDMATYSAQIKGKYGPQSPVYIQYKLGDPEGKRIDNMNWQWDGSGKKIPVAACPFWPGPSAVDSVPGLKTGVGYSDKSGNQFQYSVFMMITRFPKNNADFPACHKRLDVTLYRGHSDVPVSAVDSIDVRLYDTAPFGPVVMQLAAAQQQKNDAAHKALTQRTGPPM
jgi:hypothetical protein